MQDWKNCKTYRKGELKMIVKFYDTQYKLLKVLNENWTDIPSLDEYVIIEYMYYKIIRIVYDYDDDIIFYTCERSSK